MDGAEMSAALQYLAQRRGSAGQSSAALFPGDNRKLVRWTRYVC
jgi:hypothetical protein